MSKPKMLITQERLSRRVKELGAEISRDYQGKPLVLIGILKGAFVFLADLMRQITIPIEIDFIQVSSYNASTTSSGVIKIKKDIDLPVEGKHILLVEDIVDFGYTMAYLLKFLQVKKAQSIKVCALLDKPERRAVVVPLAYTGFTVPNKFVLGYGLDLDEKYRNLAHLAVQD